VAQYTLYAYAIGLESHRIADQLVERFHGFIASREWRCPEVWTINQQRTDGDWELGLNLSLPEPHDEPLDWYSDVEAIVAFCTELRREYQQDFVIGIADARTGCGEDIIEVGSGQPAYEYLRRFIGVFPPS